MNLFYRETGDSLCPPLIILHGMWGSSENWLPVAKFLAPYFHIFLPDCRNHGHSPHHPTHHYEVLCEDIATFIQQRRLCHKPYIIGHSMGGKALMLFLLKNPGVAEKTCIIDISPRFYLESPMQTRLLRFLRNHPFPYEHNRSDICQQIRKAFPEEALFQLLLKNICRKQQGYGWKINRSAILKNSSHLMEWPAPDDTTPYPFPVLFVKGEFSNYIWPKDELLIRKFFPKAVFTGIPETSHWIHADRPAQLAQALLSFFLPDRK